MYYSYSNNIEKSLEREGGFGIESASITREPPNAEPSRHVATKP